MRRRTLVRSINAVRGGSAEVRSHLADLGFVVGGSVMVINTIAGNIIVNVKETRVAISREMAQKIYV